jgi:hypothetical protein
VSFRIKSHPCCGEVWGLLAIICRFKQTQDCMVDLVGIEPFSTSESRQQTQYREASPVGTFLRPKALALAACRATRRATALEKWLSHGIRRAYLQQLLSGQKLLLLCGTGSGGSLSACALRQSRNSLNARPKRGNRLLDDETLVRQVRYNPLDNK